MASVLLFGFTGDNLTLKEKFDQYEKIPVFFIPGKLGVTVPATAAQCPVSKDKIESPKEYGEVLPIIISALNEGFGFSTFTAGQYDEILVKKITVSGAEVSVPDWTRTCSFRGVHGS